MLQIPWVLAGLWDLSLPPQNAIFSPNLEILGDCWSQSYGSLGICSLRSIQAPACDPWRSALDPLIFGGRVGIHPSNPPHSGDLSSC